MFHQIIIVLSLQLFIITTIIMSIMADSSPVVRVLNVNVMDNPTALTNPFQFEIIFEASRDLKDGKHRLYEMML